MKSRHQREVGEMKEQIHRANMASERDQALREKVFNEAKAEVMALSKKVWLSNVMNLTEHFRPSLYVVYHWWLKTARKYV